MRVKMLGRIRKAVIPVAGLATRLFPATKMLPKSFLPTSDAFGNIVPIIHLVAEEAISAGIEHIGLVVDPVQRDLFEAYFHAELPSPLSADNSRDYQIIKRMQKFWCRIEFITQEKPEGFGHAVFRARSWIGNEPFLLLLGDHLFITQGGLSACQQLLQSFPLKRVSLIGLTHLPAKNAAKRGAAAGTPDATNPRRYILNRIIEKPSPDQIKVELATPGLSPAEALCFFGCYAFTPTLLKILEDFVQLNERSDSEIQLTQAIDVLREIEGCDGLQIEGDSMDIGNTEDYLDVMKTTQIKSTKSPTDAQTAPDTLDK